MFYVNADVSRWEWVELNDPNVTFVVLTAQLYYSATKLAIGDFAV